VGSLQRCRTALLVSVVLSFSRLAFAESPDPLKAFSPPKDPATPPLTLPYYGIYAWPSLAAPSSRGTINTSTLIYDETSAQTLTNQFKMDVNFDANWFAGAVVNFQIAPFDSTASYMLDSGVRFGNRHVLHDDQWNLSLDLRAMAPLRPQYTSRGEVIQLQSLQTLTYTVPHSKWTFTFYGYHTFQVWDGEHINEDPSTNPKDFNLYFAEVLNYALSDKLSLTCYFEFYPYHRVGADWSSWTMDPMDISPGVTWSPTRAISISPQLLIYPTRFATDTIGTVVYLSAKLI
jgi:hypothetical protein